VLNELGEVSAVHPNIENSGRHNFGTIGPDKTPVITLPGDPISAYLSAELFVRPMIRTMLGAANIHRTLLKAILTENIESPIGATSLIRASLDQAGGLTATPLADQESLATLSDAQGLIAIAADSPGAVQGEIVDVMVLERAI
jgi:molybdopterin biosynthesis enzyme